MLLARSKEAGGSSLTWVAVQWTCGWDVCVCVRACVCVVCVACVCVCKLLTSPPCGKAAKAQHGDWVGEATRTQLDECVDLISQCML
jgi:hypothetical protein